MTSDPTLLTTNRSTINAYVAWLRSFPKDLSTRDMSDIATVLESLCREIEASSAQVAEAHKTIRQLSKPKKIKPNAKK